MNAVTRPVPRGAETLDENVRRWRNKIVVAVANASDHDDVDLVDRLGAMLKQVLDEVEHMIGEATTRSMKEALREAQNRLTDAAFDATADAVCVLDAWDLSRHGNAWGDVLDQQRMVRGDV
jgi:hypothetical protein